MAKPLKKITLLKIVRWFASGDTGTSSESMVAVAVGAAADAYRLDAPYDPSDFGRCYRLVTAVPELREHFPKIGKAIPQFKGVLKHWDELVAMYERDRPSGRSTELHKLIRQLRGDTR